MKYFSVSVRFSMTKLTRDYNFDFSQISSNFDEA